MSAACPPDRLRHRQACNTCGSATPSAGRLRFTSHRDFQRAFERALRRAALPMAYSAGFSPHPKISYVGAAPTGTASEAEYLELAVTARQAETAGCRAGWTPHCLMGLM